MRLQIASGGANLPDITRISDTTISRNEDLDAFQNQSLLWDLLSLFRSEAETILSSA
jgi:hypothetical protein